jgi:LmbE family N-acetylglucosaminyl deacetylase
MRPLGLPAPEGRRLRVLALGCHSDDIEIGAGGTLLRLSEAYPELNVRWIVLSADGPRRDEARASAEDLLGSAHLTLELHEFRSGYFPYEGGRVKDVFEELKEGFDADVIFTHHRQDLHQDHRLVCELTWNTFRDHLVLEYEIPKYDADLGQPNVYVPIGEAQCRRKVELLLRHFDTQRGKHWFTEDLFVGLMRLRGAECRSPTGYAEAFHGRKLVVEP